MTAADTPEGARERTQRPRGRAYKNTGNARSVSMLGLGMAIGAVLGAGVALLVAPHSGSDTRRVITRRVDRLRGKRGVWGKLGRELRRAAAAKKKAGEIEAKRKEISLRDVAPGNPITLP